MIDGGCENTVCILPGHFCHSVFFVFVLDYIIVLDCIRFCIRFG